MMILNLSESLAKPLVMAKLNMALSSLKNWAKLLLSSLPVSPSRVLRAPGTSSYYLVPKHLRARGPGLSNPTSFLRPALPMAPTTDNNARNERSVLRPNPATFLRDVTLYMTTKYAIIRKRCLNYNACLTLSLPVTRICVNFSTVYNDTLVAKGLTVIRREFPFGNMVKKCFAKKIAAGKQLSQSGAVIEA